jgi:integrase
MALTVKRIARLKPGRHGAGKNLYLRVKPSGAKSWVFRYEYNGRERYLGLGSLDEHKNTLAEARANADKAREQLRQGIDPLTTRTQERAQRRAEAGNSKTFEAAAQEYFDSHQHQWTNADYRQKFLSSLRTYAFQKIGKVPVAAIDTALVLKVIDPIWMTKPPTAKKVRQRIENVLDWATVRGFRSGDNPARWAGHLEEALPAKSHETKHHPRLHYDKVPAFVAKLAEQEGVPPRALEFLILTAARSGEVIGARWDEIDLDNKLWVIPAPRMKEKREHRVPLTERACAILRDLPREGEFVFIGARKNKPLGKNIFLWLISEMGHEEITVHGFRSSFRDWAGETTAFPADICEVALSHKLGGQVQTAYQRGDLLEKRRKLMDGWASFVRSPQRGASVTPIRGKQRG